MTRWQGPRVVLGACLLGIGCASARSHQPLPAARSACHIEGLAEAQLKVSVTDVKGRELPGVPVVATLVDKATARPLLERTALVDSDGWAVLDLPGGHNYQVLVRYVGFIPRSGGVYLDTGCRAEMSIELAVKKVDNVIE